MLDAPGPSLARIAWRVSLGDAVAPDGTRPRIAGGAVAADGTARVVHRGVLHAIDPATRAVRWARALAPTGADARFPCSLPLVLAEDRALVVAGHTALVFDARGDEHARIVVPMADDSGPSPNVDHTGRAIFTTMTGEVLVWEPGGLREIRGGLGYDILPVAVFADDTVAVVGYGGTGFCRVRADGTFVWKTDFVEADLLPTVSRAQWSAVGSLNEKRSRVFDADGGDVFTYDEPAVFAADDGADPGWLAASATSLARLTPRGDLRWRQPIEATPRWGAFQPLVDPAGTSYVATTQGIAAFARGGARVGELALGGAPMPLFPIAPGLLATVVGDALIVVE